MQYNNNNNFITVMCSSLQETYFPPIYLLILIPTLVPVPRSHMTKHDTGTPSRLASLLAWRLAAILSSHKRPAYVVSACGPSHLSDNSSDLVITTFSNSWSGRLRELRLYYALVSFFPRIHSLEPHLSTKNPVHIVYRVNLKYNALFQKTLNDDCTTKIIRYNIKL